MTAPYTLRFPECTLNAFRTSKPSELHVYPSNETLFQAFWTDGFESFWLTKSGAFPDRATISTVVSQSIDRKIPLEDALVAALSFAEVFPPESDGEEDDRFAFKDLVWISDSRETGANRSRFPACSRRELGFYLIVDDPDWIERFAEVGVSTFQIRVKNRSWNETQEIIHRSVEIANRLNVRLFVNDYWEFALRFGAYGIHLGQDDLTQADLLALERGGLRLGISTHCLSEVARAHAVRPSYVAVGPVFPTSLKAMPFVPQGLGSLKRWCKMIEQPIVAIGGITLERLPSVVQCGAQGVAVISAVMNDVDPVSRARDFVAKMHSPLSEVSVP